MCPEIMDARGLVYTSCREKTTFSPPHPADDLITTIPSSTTSPINLTFQPSKPIPTTTTTTSPPSPSSSQAHLPLPSDSSLSSSLISTTSSLTGEATTLTAETTPACSPSASLCMGQEEGFFFFSESTTTSAATKATTTTNYFPFLEEESDTASSVGEEDEDEEDDYPDYDYDHHCNNDCGKNSTAAATTAAMMMMGMMGPEGQYMDDTTTEDPQRRHTARGKGKGKQKGQKLEEEKEPIKPFRLLDLPAEIRLRIYEFVHMANPVGGRGKSAAAWCFTPEMAGVGAGVVRTKLVVLGEDSSDDVVVERSGSDDTPAGSCQSGISNCVGDGSCQNPSCVPRSWEPHTVDDFDNGSPDSSSISHVDVSPMSTLFNAPRPTSSSSSCSSTSTTTTLAKQTQQQQAENAQEKQRQKDNLLTPYRPYSTLPTPLLQSCRQIYTECSTLPFRRNEFVFENWFSTGVVGARLFLGNLAPWQREGVSWVRVEGRVGDFVGDGGSWGQLCGYMPGVRGMRVKIEGGVGGGRGTLPASYFNAGDGHVEGQGQTQSERRKGGLWTGLEDGDGQVVDQDNSKVPQWIAGIKDMAELRDLEVELLVGWEKKDALEWCKRVGRAVNMGKSGREVRVRSVEAVY